MGMSLSSTERQAGALSPCVAVSPTGVKLRPASKLLTDYQTLNDSASKHKSLKERVARQPVSAMNTRTRCLPTRKSPDNDVRPQRSVRMPPMM